jgi:hypothetical protein
MTGVATSVVESIAAPESLEVLAERIRVEHQQVVLAGADLVNHAIEAGRMLIDVKRRVGHGHFGRWIVANFPASAETAQRYMRLAANPSRVTSLNSIRQALAVIGPRPKATGIVLARGKDRGAVRESPPAPHVRDYLRIGAAIGRIEGLIRDLGATFDGEEKTRLAVRLRAIADELEDGS